MSEREHAPGTFCWTELATSDPDGAKKFYSELMGWETRDDPIPDAGVYTMITQGDGNVGALFGLNEEMRAANVPPHWLSYVSVADAGAAADRANQLGGKVIRGAFDVMDIGVMAVLQDPTGATFAVWQAKTAHGTDFTDARPGTVCWHELATRDVEDAGNFYEKLFGYERQAMDMPGGAYTMFMNGDARAAGMLEMNEEWGDLPAHWMVYFSVADADATAEKAQALGAKVGVPPTDIPSVGRFAVIQDPQGATFSVIKLSNPPTE